MMKKSTPRLTTQVQFPPSSFHRCQLCGFWDSDICRFRMMVECDEKDIPEPDNVLIVCDQEKCKKVLDAHPRLYLDVPWGGGDPGQFMLLCGKCNFRDSFSCTHPALKANGGEGLEIKFSNPLGIVRICRTDGTSMRGPQPATECAGFLEHPFKCPDCGATGPTGCEHGFPTGCSCVTCNDEIAESMLAGP
jgi:hypothetical protein